MRVNVSYSAELEEVPSVVLDLCVGVGDKLEALSAHLKSLDSLLVEQLAELKLEDVYLAIESVRRELNSVDIRLQDTQAMVEGLAPIARDPEGYLQRIVQEQQLREQSEQAATETVVEEVEDGPDEGPEPK